MNSNEFVKLKYFNVKIIARGYTENDLCQITYRIIISKFSKL